MCSNIILEIACAGVIDKVMLGVPTCQCKADIKPRWSRDRPLVFRCERCGKCVPGYERMWLVREREMERKKVDQ